MEPVNRRIFFVSVAVLTALVVVLCGLKQVYAEEEGPVLSIIGFVEQPVNITYSEFNELPILTEEVTCTCVGPPAFDVYTYNWTGVSVSILLELAGVKPGAVDVVFHASDGYSSSLPVEKALTASTIIAVEANGGPLSRETGYPFMLVVPCWWGYKWVKFVERIEIVDYDHKGIWENRGYPDYAEIPGCVDQEGGEKEERPIVSSIALGISGVLLLGFGVYLARIIWRRVKLR